MSGEFSRVTVIVLQKVSVDRNVSPAFYHPRKRSICLLVRPFVPVIDFSGVGQIVNVHRSSVHFGRKNGGERAVLSDVRAALCRDHCRRSIINHEPQWVSVKVSDLRPKYSWYLFQRPRRYVQEPAVNDVVNERIEKFDYTRRHHDYPAQMYTFLNFI